MNEIKGVRSLTDNDVANIIGLSAAFKEDLREVSEEVKDNQRMIDEAVKTLGYLRIPGPNSRGRLLTDLLHLREQLLSKEKFIRREMQHKNIASKFEVSEFNITRVINGYLGKRTAWKLKALTGNLTL